ncbi:hypothetical protein JTE88_01560 [Arcanobacterium phocisimile]|uniref:Uncharacterized protein n=1 Tax=Arcanobacterium phocisimile TaxID=1302235 RepID=A0ABX7IH65_9ACTO|nr:hypothetical protein [Arcanobacterium phocisimile]QRV02471.1 hypothetical protein JTE88_01560 [Arcanobacterium phocisimile]
MRIYIPMTLAELSAERVTARRVHAVTSELRATVVDEDSEGYEYIATLAAADDSLRMLGEGPESSLRRIVAVAEVVDSSISAVSDPQLPTEVELGTDISWKDVESFHMDAPGSESLISQALAGDEEAFLATGDIELLWFDISEREQLAAL